MKRNKIVYESILDMSKGQDFISSSCFNMFKTLYINLLIYLNVPVLSKSKFIVIGFFINYEIFKFFEKMEKIHKSLLIINKTIKN